MSLSDWLTYTDRLPARRFREGDVETDREVDDPALEYMSQLIFDSLANRTVVERLAHIIGADAALARLRAGRPAVARGDFGEVMAAACLEEFEDLRVPVRKLRFKIDPEQTQPGTDAVAFEMNGSVIRRAEFVESKLRTKLDRRAAEDAHAQLRADNEAGFGDIIEFTAEQLERTDNALYESFMAYLSDRAAADSPSGDFGIALVWEASAWDEDVLVRLNEVDPLLDPLAVRVIHLPDLVQLVEGAYSRIGLVMADDGS